MFTAVGFIKDNPTVVMFKDPLQFWCQHFEKTYERDRQAPILPPPSSSSLPPVAAPATELAPSSAVRDPNPEPNLPELRDRLGPLVGADHSNDIFLSLDKQLQILKKFSHAERMNEVYKKKLDASQKGLTAAQNAEAHARAALKYVEADVSVAHEELMEANAAKAEAEAVAAAAKAGAKDATKAKAEDATKAKAKAEAKATINAHQFAITQLIKAKNAVEASVKAQLPGDAVPTATETPQKPSAMRTAGPTTPVTSSNESSTLKFQIEVFTQTVTRLTEDGKEKDKEINRKEDEITRLKGQLKDKDTKYKEKLEQQSDHAIRTLKMKDEEIKKLTDLNQQLRLQM